MNVAPFRLRLYHHRFAVPGIVDLTVPLPQPAPVSQAIAARFCRERMGAPFAARVEIDRQAEIGHYHDLILGFLGSFLF